MNVYDRAMTAHGDRLQRVRALIAGLLVVPGLAASSGAVGAEEEVAGAGQTTAAATSSFQYHAPDDLAAWTAMAVLVPEDGEEKPWIEKAAGSTPWEDRTPILRVTGRRPGPRGELVGYSRLEGGPDDAMRSARRSAARQMAALAIWNLRDRIARTGLVDFEELTKLAEREAEKVIGSARVDDFEQSVDRPYGRLYRAAVLVRVSEKSLRQLGTLLESELERAAKRARAERRVLVWKGGIAAALTILAAVAYMVLNAMTRGYFTWRLRTIGLLGLVLAYTVIALIRV